MNDTMFPDPPPDPKDLVPVTQSYPAPEQSSLGLWGNASPAEVLAQATEVANVLADVVEKQGLFTMIRDKKHVRVEGWTFLGSVLNTFPICTWTRPLHENGADTKIVGWEARVEAWRHGQIIGAAEAQCLRAEPKWATAEDYAIRSMSQTRATVKALRMPLGFVVALKGYATTPAEEMDGVPGIAVPEAPQRPWPKGEDHPDERRDLGKVSPEVQEMLDKAAHNRKLAADSIQSTPDGRQRLRDAGFQVDEPEPRSDRCKKCGAEIREYTAKAGHKFRQCMAARGNPAVYDEGGHSYSRKK